MSSVADEDDDCAEGGVSASYRLTSIPPVIFCWPLARRACSVCISVLKRGVYAGGSDG